MSLQGKVAMITGASSGIGAGIARCFAREGAVLSLTGRRKEKLDAVAKTCQGTNSDVVLTTVGDIREQSTRQTLVQKTKEKFGKIDILVNNAGLAYFSTLTEQTEDQYDEQMNVNLKAPVFLTALVAPHLIETKGCVVNISSNASYMPVHRIGTYAMTKAGLDLYSKVLARELGPKGVRVNSINPGFIVGTDALQKAGFDTEVAKQFAASNAKSVPIGRNGTTEDVGRIAVFLASDDASFITGHTLFADGGALLQPGF